MAGLALSIKVRRLGAGMAQGLLIKVRGLGGPPKFVFGKPSYVAKSLSWHCMWAPFSMVYPRVPKKDLSRKFDDLAI